MFAVTIWLAVDSRGPCAIYMASDSQLLVNGHTKPYAVNSKKLFASRTQPELLGYCGDSPSFAARLDQIAAQIDCGILFPPGSSYGEKRGKLYNVLEKAFADQNLTNLRKTQDCSGSVLYCTRTGEGMTAKFHACVIQYNIQRIWRLIDLQLQESHTHMLYFANSQASFGYDERMDVSNSGRIFTSFCNAIDVDKTEPANGVPQIVGLYRKFSGKSFGFYNKGKRYLYGLEVNNSLEGDIEWRDSGFQLPFFTGQSSHALEKISADVKQSVGEWNSIVLHHGDSFRW